MDYLKNGIAVLATILIPILFVLLVIEVFTYGEKRKIDIESYRVQKLGTERIKK